MDGINTAAELEDAINSLLDQIQSLHQCRDSHRRAAGICGTRAILPNNSSGQRTSIQAGEAVTFAHRPRGLPDRIAVTPLVP